MRAELTKRLLFCALVAVLLAPVGCGTTKRNQATEQLVLSDAVDRAVAKIDFSAFTNTDVYLDQRHLNSVKGAGFVNADYIASALRQQIAAYGGRLQDSPDKAEFVLEARVGALGSNSNSFSFGVPSSQGVERISTLVQNAPPIPSIPEISLARRDDEVGAAKIGVFAYRTDTREPVWQSQLSIAKSTAKQGWLFGMGPFKSGSIYRNRKGLSIPGLDTPPEEELAPDQAQRYFAASQRPVMKKIEPKILPAGGEEQEKDGKDEGKK